ncbi:hypothetical protein ACMXZI_14775 [Bacillus subtilis]|uniref:Uncharacterized protein n=9 Tax=Bacillus subtilis group TaxID=653685 RepID=A0A6M4JJK8_BACSU|nr:MULTISPECIES: hypothetical protein [Bacillus]APD21159.1 hypothetical protein phi3T_16 [Bacillus phage phi3T]MBL3637542.1 hypothetical protein [Alkalicoccobacillus gibsonii]MCY9376475.1 hypothetical protein [Bacillus sp. T17B1]MDZ5723139.1 hypothetical protein [Bacillus sp. SXabc123]QNN96612.1 hypothetical protein [Bacillus phage phi3Ts]QNN96797.1 hypothetical protein [Bacillus phage Hyb2phi3Ts-SPbeta]QNN96985.1 hypothetical protein [Bacillus phage Hyb3phi3Ts-SPbeta]UOX38294.1 hypothetica
MDNFEQSTISRLSALEEKAKHTNNKIDSLEERTNVIGRIATLVEQQVEINKDSQAQSREQFSTLNEMSNSLKNLSKSYEKLDNRVEILERSDSTRKIDPSQFTKDLVFKVLPSVIATIIGAWLLIHFGLK